MSPRPKILMITTQLGFGGAETSFIRLANLLAESMEVHVALFTKTGTYSAGHEPLHASVFLLDEAGRGRIARWYHRWQKLRLLKRDYDATISFLSGPNLLNALAGKRAGTIVSLRGSRIYDPVIDRCRRLLFHYLLDPLIYLLARRIVVVSPGLIHELPAMCRHKTTVISPFIELASIEQRLGEAVREPYPSLKGQPVIVAVGRLSVEKGFTHLIRVFAKIATRRPGTKLLIVGDGPQAATLRSQCSALNLITDNADAGVSAVLFTGYCRNVLPYMALGKVFALTSSTEGFPNVALEAMATGLQIVAADTPWGARAMLHPAQAANAEPYPTHAPITTDYGTLMPRIDLPEYEEAWVATLLSRLDYDTTSPAAAERVRDFDLAKAGDAWKQVITSVVAP